MEASGGPNETVTRRGNLSGHRSRKRPSLKLKMLPQRRSRLTGMIGASSPLMIRSSPRLKGSIPPVRVIEPSAKMQMICPWRNCSRASSIDSATRSGSPPWIGMVFMRRKIQFKAFIS